MTQVDGDAGPPAVTVLDAGHPSAPGDPPDADASGSEHPSPRTSATTKPEMEHLPGLDGLRAIALISVFVYHGGTDFFVGSFLAVSTFFTLSGFLITLVLLREFHGTGQVRFGRFWTRRMRRLLPASVITIALAAIITLAVGTETQQRGFAGDGVSTLFDVANWHFLFGGQSYAQLFSAPSPLQHAWSLGIEAQFYLVYAAVAAIALKLMKGSRRAFGLLILGLIAVTQLPVILGMFDHDRFYYGTDARAAEMLVGALLAVALSGRRSGVSSGWSPINVRRIRVGGAVAAVTMIALWVVAKPDAWWVDRGGMAVYSCLTAVVVLAASLPRNAVSAPLSWGPLQGLGRISYGVYLFHWPILLFLSASRIPWPDPLRLLLAAAATISLAMISYRLVETPVRRQLGIGKRALALIVPVCAIVALVPTVAVAVRAPEDTLGFDQAAGTSITDADRLGTATGGTVAPIPTTSSATPQPVAPGALAPRPVVVPSRPLRVLVVGDSTALSLGPMLDDWGSKDQIWTVAKAGISGCGIVRSNFALNAYFPEDYTRCAKWTTEWPALIEQTKPDLVVLSTGFWDGTDRQFEGQPDWNRPNDPVYQQALRADYTLALDELSKSGAAIAWLDHPQVWFNEVSPLKLANPQIYDAWRMQEVDSIQRELVAGRPDVQIVETERFFNSWPGGVLDPTLRPDGLHIKGDGAAPLIDWLGPEIVHAYWAAVGQPG